MWQIILKFPIQLNNSKNKIYLHIKSVLSIHCICFCISLNALIINYGSLIMNQCNIKDGDETSAKFIRAGQQGEKCCVVKHPYSVLSWDMYMSWCCLTNLSFVCVWVSAPFYFIDSIDRSVGERNEGCFMEIFNYR